MVQIMKRFIVIILALSAAGVAVSTVLLYQHYHPFADFGMFSCGRGLVNPCAVLRLSGWDTVSGLPIAGLGVFAYLLAVIASSAALISGEARYPHLFAVLMPVFVASIAGDVVLGAILIHTGVPCRLCIATYAVNILICASLFVWYRDLKRDGQDLKTVYRTLISFLSSPGNRLMVMSSSLVMFFIFLFIISLSAIMSAGSIRPESSENRMNQFENYFNSLPEERISLPEGAMSLGDPNAEMRIIVFTDFLCTACNRFYEIEKTLMPRFWGRIRIDYYNFPLDSVCNPHAPRTVYPNSCVAAQAFIAAARRGIFREFLEYHNENFREYRERLQRGDVLVTVKEYFSGRLSAGEYERFLKETLSEKVKLSLYKDVELAGGAGIRAVPTLFINGRRLEGIPDADLLEFVLSRELHEE